ncbi:MAG: DUF4652 domain-containing protein [Bacillota bacterium]|jgi:hypothetical protein
MRRIFLILVIVAAVAGLIVWIGLSFDFHSFFGKEQADQEADQPTPAINTNVAATETDLQFKTIFRKNAWNPIKMDPVELKELTELASETYASPGKRMNAFLSPIEFESFADVYIEDVKEASRWQLQLALEGNLTPKKFLWVDDDRFLTILGYAFGTTSPGGDVYLVDARTGQGALWYKPGEYSEVTELKKEKGKIIMSVVRFDENYNQIDSILEEAELP